MSQDPNANDNELDIRALLFTVADNIRREAELIVPGRRAEADETTPGTCKPGKASTRIVAGVVFDQFINAVAGVPPRPFKR